MPPHNPLIFLTLRIPTEPQPWDQGLLITQLLRCGIPLVTDLDKEEVDKILA